jgi:homoserine trans-succinylase
MGNILSKFSDKVEYYFYEIYNKNNKTMYVGKTTDFKRRKHDHKYSGKMLLGDNIKIIMNVYCNDEWSKKIEQAWISSLTPPRNEIKANAFKNGNYYLPPYYTWKRRGYNDKEIKDLLKYH